MRKIIFGERWLEPNMVRWALDGFLPLLMVLMGLASGVTFQKDGKNPRPSFSSRYMMDLPSIFGMIYGAPLRDIFPALFVLAENRDASIADYWE